MVALSGGAATRTVAPRRHLQFSARPATQRLDGAVPRSCYWILLGRDSIDMAAHLMNNVDACMLLDFFADRADLSKLATRWQRAVGFKAL
jgi:hypothetical protein